MFRELCQTHVYMCFAIIQSYTSAVGMSVKSKQHPTCICWSLKTHPHFKSHQLWGKIKYVKETWYFIWIHIECSVLSPLPHPPVLTEVLLHAPDLILASRPLMTKSIIEHYQTTNQLGQVKIYYTNWIFNFNMWSREMRLLMKHKSVKTSLNESVFKLIGNILCYFPISGKVISTHTQLVRFCTPTNNQISKINNYDVQWKSIHYWVDMGIRDTILISKHFNGMVITLHGHFYKDGDVVNILREKNHYIKIYTYSAYKDLLHEY